MRLIIENFFSDKYLRNTFLLIFAILCINKLGIRLSGGEEQYLEFAKQFIDPSWVKNSFTLTEFPGTRILFQTIAGSALYFLSFEWVAFLGRLVNFLFISIPLALIFKKLNFKWFTTLIVVQLFVMSHQNFFGGEWMFGNFEPKTVAYIFLFFGLFYVLENQLKIASIYLFIATYFHFLVGGWFFLCLLIYFFTKNEKGWFRPFVLPFVIGMAPLVIYLLFGYFLTPPVKSPYNLNWVYCYYRLPHHLGLFKSTEYFIHTHLNGVIISAVILCLSVFLRKIIPQNLKTLNTMITIILALNLAFVILAWLDANYLNYAASTFLKYYPFRMNSLAMFLSILIATQIVMARLGSYPWGEKIKFGIVTIVIVLGVIQGINNIKRQVNYSLNENFKQMCAYIKENTKPTDDFILINMNTVDKNYDAFIMLSERDNFTVFKFVPAEKHKLNEWYKRLTALYKVNHNNKKLDKVSAKYNIDYALSGKALRKRTAAKKFGNYYLYKL